MDLDLMQGKQVSEMCVYVIKVWYCPGVFQSFLVCLSSHCHKSCGNVLKFNIVNWRIFDFQVLLTTNSSIKMNRLSPLCGYCS